jgi:hypothetical protein
MAIAKVRPGRNGALICSVCDKAAFARREEAEGVADRADQALYAYLGPECRWWHLTRTPHEEEHDDG